MMDLINKRDLKGLMGTKKGWCVSLYMPTERAGRQRRQNRIRFKNLLREAERELGRAGVPAERIRRVLDPGLDLLNDKTFWRFPSDGLASFLSGGRLRAYRLAERFDELAVVARRYHLKPLLPLLARGGRYYLLVLSQKQVRFLRGTRDTLAEIELPGIPDSMDEALKYDEPLKQLQFHTGTSQGRGKRAARFHGHGVGTDDKKSNLLRFFRQIDRELRKVLADEDAPLVLAAVDYYRPIFAEASGYRHLSEAVISGNPDLTPDDELRKRAWKIVRPILARKQDEAVASYRALESAGRASADIRRVVPAAHHGRVALLFVALGVQLWGAYDPAGNRIRVDDEPRAANVDLLDLAAVETYLTGGAVYALPPDKMPVGGPIAAVLRY